MALIFDPVARNIWPLRAAACALLALIILLADLPLGTAQQERNNLDLRKANLEVQKLELEVETLRNSLGGPPAWATGIIGLVVGTAGTALTAFLLARRERRGALDQSVHEKRLELYGQLVNATAPLALFFPSVDAVSRGSDSPAAWIRPEDCAAMGQAMSSWYFTGGGLLLSVEARDAYFRLARALTRAYLAEELRVPTFPTDAADIGVETVRDYQDELAARGLNLNDVESWSFGGSVADQEKPAFRFRDYVLLRRLSSNLRTTLSEDLQSRRLPS